MLNDVLDATALSAEEHRHAYNAAFEEVSLPWYWDSATCARFHGRDGLRAYLRAEHPHLLRAYDEDFLVNAIESAKARCIASSRKNHVSLARQADSFPTRSLDA
jgi:hypothetical protein